MPGESLAQARQQNAEMIATSQRNTSNALYALKDVMRAPVPYQPSMHLPEYKCPVPHDTHLVRSCEVVNKEDPPQYHPDENLRSNASTHGQPWATFQMPQPSVFGEQPPMERGNQGEAAGSSDEKADSTRSLSGMVADGLVDPKEQSLIEFNEWQLQVNGFNPDYAAQMRINVRKAASVVQAIGEGATFKKDHYASDNIKAALGETDVEGIPRSKPINFAQAFPQR